MTKYHREKVWDPVTRVWHWVLAIVVSVGWYLGEFMSFTTIEWHFYCGYTVLALLAFRLIWGFVGPAPIRFSSLLPKPSVIFAYVRTFGKRAPSGVRGHNPLGALSVIAILLLLTAQAASGLFVESDVFFDQGPLSHLASEKVVWRLTWWHGFLSKCILVIVALHVAAILYYLFWKKENLILPMLTGWKQVKDEEEKAE